MRNSLQVVIVVSGMLSMEPDIVLCIEASDKRRWWPSLNICGCDWISSTGISTQTNSFEHCRRHHVYKFINQ